MGFKAGLTGSEESPAEKHQNARVIFNHKLTIRQSIQKRVSKTKKRHGGIVTGGVGGGFKKGKSMNGTYGHSQEGASV